MLNYGAALQGNIEKSRNTYVPVRRWKGLPRNHIFFYLIDVAQDPGKNEFRLTDVSIGKKNLHFNLIAFTCVQGPFLAVDLDRASFTRFKAVVETGWG